MFGKFAAQTREVVACALREARDSGTSMIGCEHLLIAIARIPSGPAAEALAAERLSAGRLRELSGPPPGVAPLDAEALAVIGIDLDTVRRAAEAAFGAGALDQAQDRQSPAGRRPRLTSDARASLGLAQRVAQRGRRQPMTPGHLLVGLLDQGDNAAVRMLERADVRTVALRADAMRRLDAAA